MLILLVKNQKRKILSLKSNDLEIGSVNVGIIIFLGVKSVMLVIGISRLIRLKKNPSKRNLKELKKIELGEELSSRRVKLTQETYAIW